MLAGLARSTGLSNKLQIIFGGEFQKQKSERLLLDYTDWGPSFISNA